MLLGRLFRTIRMTKRLLVESNHTSLIAKRSSSGMVHKMDSVIEKSLNDKRNYRQILLDNGLRTLLISDPDGADETDMEADTRSDSESEEDSAGGSTDGESEEEMEEAEAEEEPAVAGKSKEGRSAAALCIGVGSFSDPPDIPGFAHFLEHMVFMGSEKYPDENNFDDYLSRHGGECNAWTDHERTCFYFDVEKKHFSKALDKFAHFFVNPLLLQDSVDREIESVDSEYQERIPSDLDRINQIIAHTAKPDNPMSKFLLGNADTLKRIPAEKGIDVYGRLRDFFTRHYSAQYMTLAVQSKHSLDLLEEWVRDSFGNISNNGKPQETFETFKDPFDTDSFHKLYKVIPIEKTHKVYLTWALPPLQKHYRVKPLEYISVMLSYDGEGGIYSYLKDRTWALEITGGNSGDGYDMNATWSGFDMCVTMTDEGLEHVNEVIQVVFEYIELMKKAGPQEWFYKELQNVEEAKFRWKEQGEATEYVEKICDNMQLYPTESYLTGHRLLFQFDHQLIKECLAHLRADNCCIVLVSSSFTEEECNLKEHWFGAQYSVEDIGSQLIAACTNPKENPRLFLPKPNQFIATDFTLKEVPQEELSLTPTLVSTSAHHKLFYKKDTKFNVPKGFVYMHLMSPVVCDTLRSSALLDLFVAIVNQNMSEPTYPAVLAGYEIGVSVVEFQSGIEIEIDGFNHKLKEVVNLVFDLVTKLCCSDQLFEAIKLELKKGFYNEMIKPYDAARMLRFSVIQKRYWASANKYEIIDSLRKEEVMDLMDRFFKQVFLETLVVGNLTKQEAVSICDSVLVKLNCQTPVEESVVQNRTIQLPCQSMYCQIPSFNPDDTNSCVYNYYQSSPGTQLKCCLNELLSTRVREPCYNTLRTKLQLGYSVFSMNHLTCGVIGLGITVECQASKFTVQYVDEKIEEFLLEMRDILAAMTEEEFENLVETVITLKKVEDTYLEQEVKRHWREILDNTYMWDRHQQEILVLKTITLQQLQDWFKQEYLGDNQRKLSVQVVGMDSKSKANMEKGQGDIRHGFHCLLDKEQPESTPVLHIEDFKKSLKTYPYTKIVS